MLSFFYARYTNSKFTITLTTCLQSRPSASRHTNATNCTNFHELDYLVVKLFLDKLNFFLETPHFSEGYTSQKINRL